MQTYGPAAVFVMKSNATVVVTQLRLTHYRVEFFEALRRELNASGVRLIFVHGQPDPSEIGKRDEGAVEWAIRVENRYWRIGKKYLAWQRFPSELRNADLIVITQENRILSNYLHLLRRYIGGSKVAFWGHGANLQSQNRNGLKERFKRWTTNHVDWWFAYTGLSVDLVAGSGFPRDRITNLENAVDTAAMQTDMAAIGQDELSALRDRLGWGDGRIGIFLGSLYTGKRLDFLLQAADRLHAVDPLFRLLIVGDGPLREFVQDYCVERPWCVCVGAKTGRDKALHLALADVLLNPGGVGLVILDAFAAGLPMVTTNSRGHGPEIAYLRQDENGLMTENTLAAFVAGVRRVLDDAAYRTRLEAGCRKAAGHYTTENMVKNFRDGVLKALAL